MGWQTQVTVQLQAGNTIINPNGTFVYSTAPGFQTLISSITNQDGTDPFGNAYVTGVTSYGNVGATWFAVAMNNGAVIFQASTAGAGGPYSQFAAVGFSFAGSTGHLTLSGTDGQLALPGGIIPVAGVSGLIATLPADGNSGTTWVSGERAFMNNNWVANINSNFGVIISALQSVGIIT
jgi:hypothetical protein